MKEIYKYVAPERVDILENLQIRITQPKYLNDLFDISVSFKKIMPFDDYEKNLQEKFDNLVSHYYEDIFSKQNRIPLSLNQFLERQGRKFSDIGNYFRKMFTEKNDKAVYSFNENINNKYGVLSFSKSRDNVPMWAHYADLYRGMVLIFNSDHDFFNHKLIKDKDAGYLDKVTYVPEKLAFESMIDMKNNSKKIFFEKHKNWENENEWRMILPLDLATKKKYPEIYLIDIPPELINGVIFGFSCDLNLIKYIKELSKDKFDNLKLYRAIPNLDNYKMDIIDFDDD